MITRDMASLQAVDAFSLATQFHSCTVSGFTCSCAGFVSTGIGFFGQGGTMIDRFGLRENFGAVAVVIGARANVNTSADSTAYVKYFGVSIGLQDSCTTCSEDFGNYSTGTWLTDYPLAQNSTATSTAGSFYSVDGAGVSQSQGALMSTALTSSTSTGFARWAGPAPIFDLGGAGRYLRIVIAPHIEVTGCGASGLDVVGSLVFGYPGRAPLSTGLRGRVHVTSACST